jgi:hypothetical protein
MFYRFRVRLKLKFITWFFNKHPDKYCWADCVSWAYSPKLNPFKVDSASACEKESSDTGSCYCGCWYKGKCYLTLSSEEKNAIIKENSITTEIPF